MYCHRSSTAYGLQRTIAQFIYNAQCRPIFYTDAFGQTSAYAYNAAGRPASACRRRRALSLSTVHHHSPKGVRCARETMPFPVRDAS